MIQSLSQQNLDNTRKAFLRELLNAVEGKQTSFAFAKHSIKKPTEKCSQAQVIVIGGSNLLSSIVSRNNGQLTIEFQKKIPLPVLDTQQTLFELIASQVNNKDISSIAFNFAYPLEPVATNVGLDGILHRSTKEHSFNGLIGKRVGHEFMEYYKKKYHRNLRVVVANDTICLVLAGLAKSDPEHLAGGVIGTGFNFGFFLDKETIVNLESGNFNNFSQSEPGIYIDKHSINPGMQLWEKEVAGAYLFQHYNYYAQQQGFELVDSTDDISALALANNKQGELARSVIQHSASLTAVEIAAICDFKKLKSMNFIIEGSLFWHGHNYREYVIEYLKNLGINMATIFHIENSSITGGAELVL